MGKHNFSSVIATASLVLGLSGIGPAHTALGAVDTGDQPLCRADNICNIAVCDNNPDCAASDHQQNRRGTTTEQQTTNNKQHNSQ